MALRYFGFAVAAVHLCVFGDMTWISSEAQCAALCNMLVLIRKKVDYFMRAVFVKFAGVGVCKTAYAAGKGYYGYLHSETNTEIRDIVSAAVVGRNNFTVDTAGAESARNDYCRRSRKY